MPQKFVTDSGDNINDAVFHPALNILATNFGAAAPEIRLWDVESGKARQDLVELDVADLHEGKITSLQFSPDGENLLVRLDINGEGYLVRKRLKLTSGDRRKLVAGIADISANVEPPQVGTVPLAAFDALRSGLGKGMSTETISGWFTDAVVVIENADGIGAGFVVGTDGYIVTCEHCVPTLEKITVRYRVTSQGKTEIKSAPAKLLRRDEARDLALLKIETASKLRTVRLAQSARSGQKVCIIGHPSLGEDVLEYTITEGIVSSANRKLDEQSFVQTTAAINPGNSGGPMFNGDGMVIGMVARNAYLDGAGFAVPASELTQFLVTASVTNGEAGKLRRDWVDASGKQVLDAYYLGTSEGKVNLQRSDGKRLSVAVDRLSSQDRSFIEMIGAAK